MQFSEQSRRKNVYADKRAERAKANPNQILPRFGSRSDRVRESKREHTRTRIPVDYISFRSSLSLSFFLPRSPSEKRDDSIDFPLSIEKKIITKRREPITRSSALPRKSPRGEHRLFTLHFSGPAGCFASQKKPVPSSIPAADTRTQPADHPERYAIDISEM